MAELKKSEVTEVHAKLKEVVKKIKQIQLRKEFLTLKYRPFESVYFIV